MVIYLTKGQKVRHRPEKLAQAVLNCQRGRSIEYGPFDKSCPVSELRYGRFAN